MTKERIDVFLSIPYGRTNAERVYWKALATAIKEASNLIQNPPLRVHSAEDEVNALIVKKNVRNLIDRCHFTIAVITGQNPNVFWEIGYTEAQKKPVVYLMDEETEELSNSPVLVVEALKCPYRASSLVDVVQNKKLPENMAIRLKSFLEQAVKSVKASSKPSLLKAFKTRDKCDLPSLIAKADSRIYLITTNLSYFADLNKFNIIKENGKKVFAFDLPVEQGVDVKILTMDPESPMVKYRADQLRLEHDVGGYREEVRKSAREFYQRYKDKGNVSIRLYDDLPLQISLIVDTQVVTGMMSRGNRGRLNLHFLLDINTPGARETFENHFLEVSTAPSRHIGYFRWAD